MIEACKTAKEILDKACRAALKGRSLFEIDQYVGALIKESGSISAPKELGFPSFACYSVNSTVVHGVATEYVLREGDIISIDVSINKSGYYGDNCRTIEVSRPEAKNPIIEAAFESQKAGIEQALVGNTPAMIGRACYEAARARGFTTVWQFGGHGIGRKLHMEPFIPSSDNSDNEHRFKAGDFITVEPIVIEEEYRLFTLPDGWTVRNMAGGLSAQFEHTIEITNTGPRILTN